MDFRLLGSVAAVAADGRELPVGSVKRRSLLAMLLLNPGAPVTVDRLTEAVWDEEPPRHARTVIQNHVSGLRALLAAHGAPAVGVELVTDGGAYLLRVPELAVDTGRFEHLLQSARSLRAAGDSVAALQEALALWRGPALAGTTASLPLQCAAQGLEELRLVAVEELARAHGRLGDHGAAAGVLRTEVAMNPLRESLVAALMLALGRAGRRSEALGWFHRTRRALADQLGIDPGVELVDAYDALLRATAPTDRPAPGPYTGAPPAPDLPVDGPPPPAPAPAPAPAPGPTPPRSAAWTFPRRPRGFSGRQDELAALDRATGTPGAIAVVTGGAGVGKTTLAVYWAHHRQTDFPDGRLFVDLCGHSPLPERSTAAVLRELLLALGLPAEQMPGSAEAMAARYRELTTDRRMLIVLDNARRSEQVRPLLPDGEGCVTVVTSRDRLGGLVASDAARPVSLSELSPPQSVTLLAATLGTDLVSAEPEAAARLVGLCDGLPLALRLAAARIATCPARSLAALADELADEQRRLGLLEVEDTSLAAALALTVQHLSEPARRMFHRLGAHTGATLDSRTAAALADCRLDQAAGALDQLATAHLLVEIGQDAYTLHDLVRLYARSMPGDDDADADVLPRLLDHLLNTLLAASAAAEPGSEPCCALPPGTRRPAEVRPFPDRASALAWYAVERDTLRGAVAAAVAAGLHDRAWRLVLLQWPLIVWQARDGWVPLLEHGLAAAEADLDPGAQSRARALLGWVLLEEGRHEEALAHLEQAPGLAALAGDGTAQAVALVNLAVALARYGRSARVRDLLTTALALATQADRAELAALARQHLADDCLAAGDPEEAAHHAACGLALAQPPFPVARQVVLETLYGRALAAIGRPEEAALHLGAAVRTARAHQYGEGESAARAALHALSASAASAAAMASAAAESHVGPSGASQAPPGRC
ncbi:DNA-binding SARP family transcriptional activator/tetratricopeptide (TPR) repeat protein [Kitasatospora sp. MAA19]|uniref:AfsR/SARP family transcriptional regulator n=1 Tax=Kitasatospora sp. MAA19 TaxID=3035090 RepID=UPI002475ACF6|nr:AfsR/SARP family transcriptional regulator [Kitasatospora sp. MAA19]MDH6710887.1 DNA-binding SARP family transcriptional activator/tetratricopeptide (TPR) repeat protein [Kitasatospora sp. MAA19]